ncbi:MAG TPA: ATP-binding protein [Puia sp.]|jgi:signal transduction histidine kinase/ActR/RegA family two-component response regulator
MEAQDQKAGKENVERALQEANERLRQSELELLHAKAGLERAVTERKESELALREISKKLERSNHLLDVSQRLSATAGWELDLLTGEVFWTRQAYVLYDVADDFIPTLENTLHFFEEEDRLRLEIIGGKAISENRSYDIEVRMITAKNVRKWVRSIGVPVIKNGRTVSIQGALMDVTQKKQTELELIRARDLAEDSAKAKTDFLSVMSHEIRTPLNGIIGIANLLKLNYTTDQEEYIRNLIFCADHLLRLINDILDLTKMESDKLEFVYAEVDLFQLAGNIRNQFKSLAESKGLLLENSIGRGVPQKILADPIRLGQILNNLVSNAIKFTEEGEVTLMLNLASKRKDTVVVRFSVKDTGIGIPAEMQESVFESFKQVQQSAYRKHSGTGLGLTITRKLIELHNSRIFLKSIPGFGTEFAFDLEFGLPDQGQVTARAVADPVIEEYAGKLGGLRLLLVEDNPINVLVACKQLEYFGIHPDCAYGGQEALEFLNRNDYHIALLDLHMPEIDGYALAKIIRRQYAGIHIIIFTADIMTEVRVKLARMEIYDILNKPFAPETMFGMLMKVVQTRNILLSGQEPGAQ